MGNDPVMLGHVAVMEIMTSTFGVQRSVFLGNPSRKAKPGFKTSDQLKCTVLPLSPWSTDIPMKTTQPKKKHSDVAAGIPA